MNERGALADLGPRARSLLEVCAVLGETFTFSQMLSILGDPKENGTARFVLLSGWEEIRRKEILVAEEVAHPERLRFSVPEERHEVLGQMSPSERERLEQRIADSALG